MARKVVTYIVPADGGRDAGKHFVLTELSALDGERWAMRAFLALSASGIEVPDDVRELGLAGIATMGLRAFTGAQPEIVLPLFDEMLTCAKYMPDPARPDIIRPVIGPDDPIEEIKTVFMLRREIIDLHTGFFTRAAALRSQREAAMKDQKSNSPSTETSPKQ